MSQQLAKLLGTQSRGTYDRAQGATVQGPVIRHNNLTKWFSTPQNNMASHLADDMEASPLQNFNAGPAGNYGKVGHTVTRRASKCSSGTGSLSASRALT